MRLLLLHKLIVLVPARGELRVDAPARASAPPRARGGGRSIVAAASVPLLRAVNPDPP